MSKNTEIRAKITADAAGFNRSADQAARRAQQLKSELSSSISSFGTSLAGYATGFLSIQTAMDAVREAAKFESITLSLKAVGSTSMSTAAQLEQLREMAKLPGLDFKSAAAGMIRLQAVGFSAGESARVLKEFANALALVGGTGEDMQGVVLALGQIMAKGKVMAQEISQIAERLPTVRVAMAKAFGTADTEKLQAKGLEAREFLLGMADAMEKSARAGTGLNKSLTLLSDSADRAKAAFGGLATAAGGGAFLGMMTGALDNAAVGWEVFTDAVINDLPKIKTALASADPGKALGEALIPAAKRKVKDIGDSLRAQTGKEGVKIISETSEDVTNRQKDAAEECANYAKEEAKATERMVGLRREIGDLSVRSEAEALDLARKRFYEFGGFNQVRELRDKVGSGGNAQEEAKIAERLREGLKLQAELGEAQKKVEDSQAKAAEEAAQRNKDQIDSVREMVDLRDTLIEKEKQITAEAEKQRQFRRDFAEDSRIEQLRGQGRNRQADRMERDKRIEQSKRALIEQGGMSPADAEKEARRAERSRNGRITTNERQRRPEFGALDEFNNRQKGRFDPLAEDAKKNADKKNRRNKVDVQEKAQTESEKQLGALVKAVESIQKSIDQASKKKGMEAVN